MSDLGAGIPLGIPIGFGAGIGAGIAAGKRRASEEISDNIRRYVAEKDVKLMGADGQQLPLEDFITTTVTSAAPGAGNRRVLVLSILGGALVLAGVLFALGYF